MNTNYSVFFALRLIRLSASFVILAVFSGCGTFYHKMDHVDLIPSKKSKPGTRPPKPYNSVSDASVHSLAIDAKQRVVFFTERDGNNVVCAEPSPDALSALSSNFSSSFQNNSKAIASLGASISESATSIGLRTQSIQLLRDGMYRSCEAYAAGAIDKDEYNSQQRRYQNLMLSLLAIEQISGAIVAPPAGLGGGKASGSVGESANEAAVELAQAETDLESAQKALNAANETKTKNSEACAKVDEDKREKDATCTAAGTDDENIATQQEVVRAAEMKRDNAKLKLQVARSSISTSASGATINYGTQYQNSKLTDASAKYIVEAARTIVSTTLLASFAQEECTKLWKFVSPGKIRKPELEKTTSKYYLDPKKSDLVFENLDVEDLKSKKTITKGLMSAGISDVDLAGATLDSLAKDIFDDRIQLVDGGDYWKIGQSLNQDQLGKLVNTLIENCANNSLSKPEILYTPQYPSVSIPLEILNADKAKSLKVNDPAVSLQITGGRKPYTIKNPEGKVTISWKSGEVLSVIRPAGSPVADDETTLFLMDAEGALKEIKILLPK